MECRSTEAEYSSWWSRTESNTSISVCLDFLYRASLLRLGLDHAVVVKHLDRHVAGLQEERKGRPVVCEEV